MSPSRKDVGHVLVIASLDPRITPKLHWAMIKDDIRSLCPEASKGPGRVNTERYSCTVDMHSKEDAEIVLAKITLYGLPKFQGSKLLVHYLQTYPGNRTEIVGCNGGETACRDGGHAVGQEDYFGRLQAALFQAGYAYMSTTTSSGPVPVMPTYAAATPPNCSMRYPTGSIPAYAASSVPNAGGAAYYMQHEVAVRTLYTVPASPYQHTVQQSVQQPIQPAYQPQYTTPALYQTSPSTGLPINTTAGTVETESRGIHISNISYKISEHDLKKFIKQYGQPTRVSLKKDSNGKSKGSAVVTFRSANEASIAAGRLHGVKWKGFELKVKLDREGATSAEKEQGPVIANGSTST